MVIITTGIAQGIYSYSNHVAISDFISSQSSHYYIVYSLPVAFSSLSNSSPVREKYIRSKLWSFSSMVMIAMLCIKWQDWEIHYHVTPKLVSDCSFILSFHAQSWWKIGNFYVRQCLRQRVWQTVGSGVDCGCGSVTLWLGWPSISCVYIDLGVWWGVWQWLRYH